MLVIGCDYHPSVQHIAWIDRETGECGERQLRHRDGEAEKFYRDLNAKGVEVRVGIEATGHARWFERWLAELELKLWVRRKRGNRKLVCSGCGRKLAEAYDTGCN